MLALAEVPLFFTHIFPWPFIFVGGAFACTAARDIIRAAASYRWPTVDGKIVFTEVEATDTGGDYPHDLFTPVIEYRYALDAVTKTGRKLALVDLNPGSRARAEAILRRYKTGGAVRVYVSPEDPEIAVLDPGLRWPMVGKLIFGLLFMGAGLVMLLVFGWLGPWKF